MPKLRSNLLYPIVALLCFNGLNAQNFKILKDINAQTNSVPANATNSVTTFAVAGGKAFFTADDGIHGRELWCSDGTTAGTHMVKDIYPGIYESVIRFIYPYKNIAYFFAEDQSNGLATLWASDGTEKGTVIVKDSFGFQTLMPSFGSNSFTIMNDTLYFTASTRYTNDQLWKTDGTKKGTQLVVDLNQQPGFYNQIANFTLYGKSLFFTVNNGQQLWLTDGTTAGTQKFRTLQQSSFSVSKFAIVNGLLTFISSGSLWVWGNDPLYATQVQQSGITNVITFGNIKNSLYVIAASKTQYGLYKVNTSAANKYSLICPASANSMFLGNTNDSLLYFTTTDSTTGNINLWQCDGVTTKKLLNDAGQYLSYYAAGKKLYFSHWNNEKGEELWSTDGTIAGTGMVKDINPGNFNSSPNSFTQLGTSLLFNANTNNNGIELWKTDGTDAGTALVKDINTTKTADNYPRFFVNNYDTLNKKFMFWAYDGIHGDELWTTDGTTNGTTLLSDVMPGSGSGDGTWYPIPGNTNSTGLGGPVNTRFKGYDYFFGVISQRNADQNYGLFKTNGLPGGTSLVKKITDFPSTVYGAKIGANSNYVLGIFTVNGNNTADTAGKDRLYAFNEKGDTTLLKKGFTTTLLNVEYGKLPVLGNDVYFFNYNKITGDGGEGLELWKSDGTVAGTKIIKNLYPGRTRPLNNYAVTCKNQLFFMTYSGFVYPTPPSSDYEDNQYYLWKSDGTTAGTTMLCKISDTGVPMYVMGDKVYFIGHTDETGDELWVSDGTTSGTHIVKDINPGTSSSAFYYLYAYGSAELSGYLYFSANDGNGLALWRTNGTDTGTVKISSATGALAKGNGKLYFIYRNAEIWQTDGTTAGTKKMPGAGLSGVSGLHDLLFKNNRLYFTGSNFTTGTEVYTTDQEILPLTLLSFAGRLQTKDGLLQWATANELNTSHFNLQRSLNGADFTTIARVAAQGDNVKNNYYSFTDANVTNYGTTNIYYRLQQVDEDGRFTYSNIIKLAIPAGSLLSVSPNPAVSYTNLYSSINISGALITVTDINGHTVYTSKQNIQQGSKTVISLNGYAKGVYTINISSPLVQKQELKVVVE